MSFCKQVYEGLPRLPSKAERKANQAKSPWAICRSLSAQQYLYFSIGFSAWVMDAFDFFAVSVTLTRLRAQFQDRRISDLTTAITLTLLFRSVGALGFGIAADRFGCRWLLTANLILIGVLALATGFVQTFAQFLAVRAVFGIMMGGIYGMAIALENMPTEARGLFSGLFQQGYSIGYLLAASVNLSLVTQTDSWRSIFYLGAGLSFSIALLRASCPESNVFVEGREEKRLSAETQGRSPGEIYWQTLRNALRKNWGRFVFAMMLMTGFNFFSHGSQDLYPTFAQVTKGMSWRNASLLTIIGNCGAIVGGVLGGWLSQYLGRRLSIIVMCLWATAFIPLWIVPTSFSGLALGSFFVQFGIQGAWGVIPIYLSEISPPGCLAIFTGFTYQLGNMISAAGPEIEARAAELHEVVIRGAKQSDYAVVLGVTIGSLAGYIIILTAIGKEYRGRALLAHGTTTTHRGITIEVLKVSQDEEKDGSD